MHTVLLCLKPVPQVFVRRQRTFCETLPNLSHVWRSDTFILLRGSWIGRPKKWTTIIYVQLRGVAGVLHIRHGAGHSLHAD